MMMNTAADTFNLSITKTKHRTMCSTISAQIGSSKDKSLDNQRAVRKRSDYEWLVTAMLLDTYLRKTATSRYDPNVA